jgi:hypothetical protein
MKESEKIQVYTELFKAYLNKFNKVVLFALVLFILYSAK